MIVRFVGGPLTGEIHSIPDHHRVWRAAWHSTPSVLAATDAEMVMPGCEVYEYEIHPVDHAMQRHAMQRGYDALGVSRKDFEKSSAKE